MTVCVCLKIMFGRTAGGIVLDYGVKKREYRQAFYHFDPVKIAQMSAQDIDRCMQNAGLIRYRAKLKL